MADETPDGTLHQWPAIADAHDWQTLILGNGLSTNVWAPFGYRTLFDHAARSELTEVDQELFAGTTNFESVLADIGTAIRVASVAGVETGKLYERYHSIQRALGQAIRRVHVTKSEVPSTTLALIRTIMEEFEWIFTTSYDLLLYWAMGYGGRYAPFKDHFRYGGRCQFDPARADVLASDIPVYYLHGALHLVVGSSGATWKLTATSLHTILDQFGRSIAGDSQARPLLVTEGSAAEKLRAIDGNEYLSHCLDRLRTNDLPTVIFGSSLSAQDDHLVDALNEHRDRPVAVSMLPRASKREQARAQVDLWGRLEVETLYFYDARTHPLGGDLAPSPA